MGEIEKMIAIEMEEEKEETFEELMGKADKLYLEGKWKDAADKASLAKFVSKSEQQEARARDRRAWSHQKIGYKAVDDENLRAEAYKVARYDWESILLMRWELLELDITISVVKGLMLLPPKSAILADVEIERIPLILNQELARLYLMGEREIKWRIIKNEDEQLRRNFKADLLNSLGIQVRNSDTVTAEKIFIAGFKISQSGATITGHLMQNCATCHLIRKNKAEDKAEKLVHAQVAIERLKIALEPGIGYPIDQVEHRRNTQRKIDNTLAEIKNNFE